MAAGGGAGEGRGRGGRRSGGWRPLVLGTSAPFLDAEEPGAAGRARLSPPAAASLAAASGPGTAGPEGLEGESGARLGVREVLSDPGDSASSPLGRVPPQPPSSLAVLQTCFRGVHQFKGPAPSGSAGCASSSARPTALSPDQCGSRGSGPAPSALFPTITPATSQPSGHLGVTGSSARSLGAPGAGRMSLKGRPWETAARSPLCHPHTLLQPRRSHAQRTTELHPWQES